MKNSILSTYNLNHQVITSAHEKLHILRDINLNIIQGESVAIIGASGSGKSTLLGMLAGLDQPSGGYVEFLGKNLNNINEDERAILRLHNIGFVFQSFQLINSLSALENVMLPLELQGNKTARSTALNLLEQVGLKERINHTPLTLSGGEQQRTAIARAFAVSPKILFADEPTGNLDSVTGENIAKLIFGLNKSLGTTLVLVTHDLNLAKQCKRQIKLEKGAVI